MHPFIPPPRTPNDPTATHGSGRLGGVGNASDAYSMCEWGTVADVQADRYTYTVKTLKGRMLQGVPRKRMHPSDIALLPLGTTVIVRHDLGLPIIDGVLDIPATPSTTTGVPTTGATGFGGQGLNQTTNTSVGSYRSAAEPTDMLPGDMLSGNRSGARVGVLEGGVAMLRGSPMAQVRAYALQDLVEIISRNFRHITDMGIFEVTNADGRVNMSFRGATDQLGETGGDEENWTIRMDLGSVGDLFDFQLTTPQGQTLFKIHVDAGGRCEIFGLDGVIIQSGSQNDEPHIADHATDVIENIGGDHTVTVTGDETVTVQGGRTDTVDGSSTVSVGADYQLAAARDLGLSAGRNAYLNVTGAKDGNPALTTTIQGGDWKIDFGQPQFPLAGLKLKTLKGNISMESQQGGTIELKTLLGEIREDARKITLNTKTPDSVILGGTSPMGHVTIYERLESLLRVLIRLFDSHTHTSAAAGSPTTPPLVPMSAAISPMILPMKSTRVGVGG